KHNNKNNNNSQLKLLADRFPVQMRKILEDLVADVDDCVGKERSDALNSLKDCASASPESIVKLLLNPPAHQSDQRKVSIEVLLDAVDPRDGDDAVAAASILLLLLQPPVSMQDCRRIRRKWMTVERTRRLLKSALHHTDALPKKRTILVETLKKYGSKSAFLDAGGMQALLRYLDKNTNEKGS
ncbi:hypothetical protein PMAYCL1PPCAC_10989, partial [Pristionchus mayeri]